MRVYIIKAGVCVCQRLNVPTLTSPPVLMLWGTQGYLWLPYDLTKVIKLFGLTKFFFSKKILYVIPSALLSFLPYYCHSFRITVIPSVLVSFLPDYCHSFRIGVIPSELFRELQILTSSKSFPHPKGEKNGHRRSLKSNIKNLVGVATLRLLFLSSATSTFSS
jgi:hypothetical protein